MRSPTFSKQRVALLLVALLTVAVLPLPTAQAGTTIIMGAHLPTTRDGTAAVATDDAIYIFGGDSGNTRHDDILRYDVQNDTLSLMTAKLPSPRSGMSAVWTGEHVYLFGGWGSPYVDQIVRYDPAADTVTVMSGKLPSARIYTSAVFDGQHVYIFGGGISSAATTDQIVRYDPATDSVTTLGSTLPSPRYGTSAVFDGQYAYIFGGITLATGIKHDHIVRFDPVTHSVDVLSLRLPTPRYHTSAIYAGGAAHLFGGYDCGSGISCDTILDIDLAAGTLAANETVLTSGRYLTSAAYHGRYAYIIGGIDGSRKDQILRHGPIEPNRAPTIDPVGDLSHPATEPLEILVQANDIDADPITLTANGLPLGASFTDHGNGTATLAWTPTRAQQGAYTLAVTANDGELDDTETFTITVTRGPDRLPVFDPIADQNATAGQPFGLGVRASDPDGDPITLTLGAPSGASLTDHGDGNGTIHWTPTEAQVGTHTLTADATAFGNTTTATFNVTVVHPPNAPPTIDPIPDGEAYFGDTITVAVSATDPDGDDLTLALAPLPANATFTDHGDGTGTLVWNVDASHHGVHTLTVTADDGNDTANESFTITVWSARPPTISPIDDRQVEEGETFGFSVAASDPQNLSLTLSISPALPPGANFTDLGNGTGNFTWNVSYDAQGVHAFTITASNGERTASESFTITVIDFDLKPIIDSNVSEVTVAHHDTVTLDYLAHDPDGTPIAWTATGLPAGATFIDNGDDTATFTWSDATPIGTHVVTLKASSNGASATAIQKIKVVRLYEFHITQIGPAMIEASPDEVVPLEVRITNTGFRADNYTFTTFDAAGLPEGFLIEPVGMIHLEPGASRNVVFNVTVPGPDSGATYSKPRIVADSEGGASHFMNWIIRVPVKISIDPVDENPSLAEQETLIFFYGHVNLTWANGSVAPDLRMQIRHTIQNVLVTDPIAGSTRQVQADENGTWRFDGSNVLQPGEATYGLPGVHHLTVSVTRGLRTDTETGTWQILV